MAFHLRSLAIAASLCTALPLTAQASVLSLDFEDLSLVAGTGQNLATTQPYASKLLSFSGTVYANKWSADGAGLAGIPQPPASAGLNFAGGLKFELLIDSSDCTSANAGAATYGCFNRLSMSALASSGGSISIYDSTSSTNPALIVRLAGSGGATSEWDSVGSVKPLETLGMINRIVFEGGTDTIYFDGLSMTYANGTTGPGGVPEPGGLALVLLALAGLGLSRRAKR